MPGDLLPVFLACLETDTCLILSGEIGAGKTSVANHLATELDEQRGAVGGILSPRIIEDGATIGYTIRDLMTDEERPFASLDPPGCRWESSSLQNGGWPLRGVRLNKR